MLLDVQAAQGKAYHFQREDVGEVVRFVGPDGAGIRAPRDDDRGRVYEFDESGRFVAVKLFLAGS